MGDHLEKCLIADEGQLRNEAVKSLYTTSVSTRRIHAGMLGPYRSLRYAHDRTY